MRVPRADLLDRYGAIDADGTYSSPIENPKRRFFTMLGTLVRGRISVAGAAGAATESALTIAIRYALRRRQFERTEDGEEVLLLDYQAHQRRLLPALATTYALHLAQSQLTEELHDVQTAGALGGDGGDENAQRTLETQAAGIKAVGTAHANATVQACREACGGAGFLAENLLVQLRADVDVFATFEGDNTVLLQLVGKGLLTGYKHHVGELDSFGVARFVAEQLVTSVIERAVVAPLVARLLGTAPGKDGERGVHDRAWHLTLFEDREKHLLETLAQRLRAASRSGEAFDAFNGCQEHLLATARAHVHRLVLESFAAADRRLRGRRRRHPARRRLRPLRARAGGGRPRVVPRARPDHPAPRQGGHRRGRRPLRRAAAARRRPGRRLRHPRAPRGRSGPGRRRRGRRRPGGLSVRCRHGSVSPTLPEVERR